MDDLLAEFLTETAESLDAIELELLKLEQDPGNAPILSKIFRLVHTIKGACGFLGMTRLQSLTHSAETLLSRYRDGAPLKAEAIRPILRTLDRIKSIVAEVERAGREPEGSDDDVIGCLLAPAEGHPTSPAQEQGPRVEPFATFQTAGPVDSPLMPSGYVSLEELERAFREAPGPAEAKPTERSDTSAEPGEQLRTGATERTVRVPVDALEGLAMAVSELVLTRNQLLDILCRTDHSEFKVPLQRLSNLTGELQEHALRTSRQPIGDAWQRLPRIVSDLASELGKKIELEMRGAETELDRHTLEIIRDPLIHMVRNAADHGLEPAEERVVAGKAETGTIRLTAYREGDATVIEIRDDGRGFNTQRIRDLALAQGLATEGEFDVLSPAEVNKLVFRAGFSTAECITTVSGRGVGMDVVRNNIELIGGEIDVESMAGVGTIFKIKIPQAPIVSSLTIGPADGRLASTQFDVVEPPGSRGGGPPMSEVDATQETTPPTSGSRHVLLIDDSVFFRSMLAPLLSEAGYEVTLASSAEEAIELENRGAYFDVIVSDLEMPGTSGIEFARSIREGSEWAATPLIALSSQRSATTVERMRDVGFSDHVGKFDREGLMSSLNLLAPRLDVAA